jgi:transcriptional regulator with XRE-family HTH domain
MEALGPYIRSLRGERDLSLREFAKQIGYTPAFVSDVELGRRHPSDEVLAEMARVLKVDIKDLKARDTRAPIEDIKNITQADPKYALAFRTVIEKKISADDLIELLERSKKTRPPK